MLRVYSICPLIYTCVLASLLTAISAAQEPQLLADCTFSGNTTALDGGPCPILNANSSMALVADSTWGMALSCTPPDGADNETLSEWISTLPVLAAVPYGSAGPFAINLWFKPGNLSQSNSSTGQFLFSQVPGTLALRGRNISAELNASITNTSTSVTDKLTQASGVPNTTAMLNAVLARRAARNASQLAAPDTDPAPLPSETLPTTRRAAMRHLMQDAPDEAATALNTSKQTTSVPTIVVTRHAVNESRTSGATFPNQVQVFLPAGIDPAVGVVRTLIRDADDGGTEPLFLDSDGFINNLDGISNDPFHTQIREGMWHMLTITTLKPTLSLSSQALDNEAVANASAATPANLKGYAIYLDGMLAATLADSQPLSDGAAFGFHPSATGGGPMHFGNGSIHVCIGADLLPDSLFMGRMANLKIFNRALNMEDVQQLHADDMAAMTEAGRIEVATVATSAALPDLKWPAFHPGQSGLSANQSAMNPQQQQQQQVVLGPDGVPLPVGGNPFLSSVPKTPAMQSGSSSNDTMPDAHGVTVSLPEDDGGLQPATGLPSKPSEGAGSAEARPPSEQAGINPPSALPLPSAANDSDAHAALPLVGPGGGPGLSGHALVVSPQGHGMSVVLPEDLSAKTIGAGPLPGGADAAAALTKALLNQQQQQQQPQQRAAVTSGPALGADPSLTSTLQTSSGTKTPLALGITLGVSLGVCAALAVLVAALLVARARRPAELVLATLAGTRYAPTGLSTIDSMLLSLHRGASVLSRGVVPAPFAHPQQASQGTGLAGVSAAGTPLNQHPCSSAGAMPPAQVADQAGPAHASVLVGSTSPVAAAGHNLGTSAAAPASAAGGSQTHSMLWGRVSSLLSLASHSLLSSGPTSHQPDNLPVQGRSVHTSAVASSPDGKLEGKRRILALPLFSSGKQHGHAISSSPIWRNLTLSPKTKRAPQLALPGIMASPCPGPVSAKTPPAKPRVSQTGSLVSSLAHPLDSPVAFAGQSTAPGDTDTSAAVGGGRFSTPGSFTATSFTTTRHRHTAGGAGATPSSALAEPEPGHSSAAKQPQRATAASSTVASRKGAVPASPATTGSPSPANVQISMAGQPASRAQTRLRAARAAAESSSFTVGGGAPGPLDLLGHGVRRQTEPGAPPSPAQGVGAMPHSQPPSPRTGDTHEAMPGTLPQSKPHAP